MTIEQHESDIVFLLEKTYEQEQYIDLLLKQNANLGTVIGELQELTSMLLETQASSNEYLTKHIESGIQSKKKRKVSDRPQVGEPKGV